MTETERITRWLETLKAEEVLEEFHEVYASRSEKDCVNATIDFIINNMPK